MKINSVEFCQEVDIFLWTWMFTGANDKSSDIHLLENNYTLIMALNFLTSFFPFVWLSFLHSRLLWPFVPFYLHKLPVLCCVFPREEGLQYRNIPSITWYSIQVCYKLFTNKNPLGSEKVVFFIVNNSRYRHTRTGSLHELHRSSESHSS
jgi:hypothetical protein